MKTLIRPLLEAAVVLFLVFSGLRWVLGLFEKRQTTYRLTAGRQLRLAFWPGLAVLTGLSVVPAVALAGRAVSGAEWGLAVAFLAATLALGGPALLLHARYWALNRDTALVFQPEQNQLEVYEGERRYYFERQHLVGVDRVTCRARHAFRTPYDYLRLRFSNGESVVLTSLLTDLEPVAAFLRSVPGERKAVRWCWV